MVHRLSPSMGRFGYYKEPKEVLPILNFCKSQRIDKFYFKLSLCSQNRKIINKVYNWKTARFHSNMDHTDLQSPLTLLIGDGSDDSKTLILQVQLFLKNFEITGQILKFGVFQNPLVS